MNWLLMNGLNVHTADQRGNGREANPELAHETIEAYQIRCKRLIHIYIWVVTIP